MSVDGFGGGAISPGDGGGGAAGSEGVLVALGGSAAAYGVPDGVFAGCSWLSSLCPESVKVGTPSGCVTADAFGVVSWSVCGLRMVESGGCGMAALPRSARASFRDPIVLAVSLSVTESSSPRVLPTSLALFSSGDIDGDEDGPRLAACCHEPRNDSTHCGRRKQKSTAEATIKDIPRSAIAHALRVRDDEIGCN